MRDLTTSYFESIKNTAPLSNDEERELSIRIRDGDQEALNKLVESNLKFVVKLCLGFRGRGLEMVDMVSEGNRGLCRAAIDFDGTQGNRFTSYAVNWVRAYVERAIHDNLSLIRISTSKIVKVRRIQKARKDIEKDKCSPATSKEIAAIIGTNKEVVEKLLSVMRVESLDAPAYEEDFTIMGTIPSDTPNPEDEMENKEQRAYLDNLLQCLPAREMIVLKMLYGLDDGCAKNLEQVANKMKLSRERIRQLQKKAIERLQPYIQGKCLAEFVR